MYLYRCSYDCRWRCRSHLSEVGHALSSVDKRRGTVHLIGENLKIDQLCRQKIMSIVYNDVNLSLPQRDGIHSWLI
jgi:hypothetical protein